MSISVGDGTTIGGKSKEEMQWYEDGESVVFINNGNSLTLKKNELNFIPKPELKIATSSVISESIEDNVIPLIPSITISFDNDDVCTNANCNLKCGKTIHDLVGKPDTNGNVNIGENMNIEGNGNIVSIVGHKS